MNIVEALTSEEIIVIYQILYFSDTASIEAHFYVEFQEYLMLCRKNGIKTWVGTKTNEYKSYVVVERLYIKAHSCENVTEVKKRHWLQIARTFSI